MMPKVRLKSGDTAAVVQRGTPSSAWRRGRVVWVGERSQCAEVFINGKLEMLYLRALVKVEGNRFTEALAYPQSASPRATGPQMKKTYPCHLPLAALHALEDE